MRNIECVNKFYNSIKSKRKEYLKKPTERDSIVAAIELAYGDAQRTMTGISNYQDAKETALKELCNAFQKYFDEPAPEDTTKFTCIHHHLCNIWVDKFKENETLSKYGKAQKIVNMTFKYLYCCESTKGYEKHFEFCHMPLDSFTLEWFYREYKKQGNTIARNSMSNWSSLNFSKNDFDTKEKYSYGFYQEKIRQLLKNENFNGLTPLQAEFIIWPEMQLHLAAEAFYSKAYEYLVGDSQQEKTADFKKRSLECKLQAVKDLMQNYPPQSQKNNT